MALAEAMTYLGHDAFRPSQESMILHSIDAFERGGQHLAAAPTGIGKTAAALSAALTHAKTCGESRTVFFLTGRQSQHRIVIETLRNINKKLGANDRIRAVDLIGREAMCVDHDRHRGICGCDRGLSEGLKEERKDAFIRFALAVPRHAEELIRYGREQRVCAWGTARTLVSSADVFIGDYNHLFLDQVRSSSLASFGLDLTRILLIVDEGHNLPERIRMGMERVLTPDILRNALYEVEEHHGNLLGIGHDHLGPFEWSMDVLRLAQQEVVDLFRSLNRERQDEDEMEVDLERVLAVIDGAMARRDAVRQADLKGSMLGWTPDIVERFDVLIGTLMSVDVETDEDTGEREPDAHRVAALIETLLRFRRTDALVLVHAADAVGGSGRLTSHLLDPGLVAGPIFKEASGSLIMSGTLYPPAMYADLLDLEASTTTVHEYPSPFQDRRRPIMVATDVTTRYAERGPTNTGRLRSHLRSMVHHAPGNVAVFAPSYRLLEEVISEWSDCPREVMLEDRGWTKNDVDGVLDRLLAMNRSDQGLLLGGVFGGRLSEGVDFHSNMLTAVVCIGLQIPPPSVRQDALVRYLDGRFRTEGGRRGLGVRYGSQQPAVNATLQAMGRAIRSLDDRALILLADHRHLNRAYRICHPTGFQPLIVESAEATGTIARRFFTRYP